MARGSALARVGWPAASPRTAPSPAASRTPARSSSATSRCRPRHQGHHLGPAELLGLTWPRRSNDPAVWSARWRDPPGGWPRACCVTQFWAARGAGYPHRRIRPDHRHVLHRRQHVADRPAVAGRGTLAIGQTLIILTAGIDLSSARSWRSAASDRPSWPPKGVPAVRRDRSRAWSCAASSGGSQRRLVTKIRLPPFIVTLGMLNVAFALTHIYSEDADGHHACPAR